MIKYDSHYLNHTFISVVIWSEWSFLEFLSFQHQYHHHHQQTLLQSQNTVFVICHTDKVFRKRKNKMKRKEETEVSNARWFKWMMMKRKGNRYTQTHITYTMYLNILLKIHRCYRAKKSDFLSESIKIRASHLTHLYVVFLST